jgi:hypothetical protein
MSGRGSVWLERCVRDAEVGGSNPLAPTIYPSSFPALLSSAFFVDEKVVYWRSNVALSIPET